MNSIDMTPEHTPLQEVFDKVLAAIRTQDGPSLGTVSTCAYRSTDGRRCAIGHLMTQWDYRRRYEGCAVEDQELDELFDLRTDLNREFCGELQVAHDEAAASSRFIGGIGGAGGTRDAAFMAKFEVNMKGVASLFNLVYEPKTNQGAAQ